MALLIGVGNYPEYKDKSGWGKIHSTEDVALLGDVLRKAGFQVQTLTNANATHDGIMNKLTTFTNECKPRDMVLIHFSGHGQQMPDLMHDESDKLTEAFIPYDAHRCVTQSYRGQAHLTDDEIKDKLTVLRNKLGPNGLLMVTIDACHSEGSTRTGIKLDSHDLDPDTGRPICRGTNEIFKTGKRTKRSSILREDASKLIELSACGAGEKNFEYYYDGYLYGRLSLIIAKKIPTCSGFNELASSVIEDRTIMNKNQHPKLTIYPVGEWSSR